MIKNELGGMTSEQMLDRAIKLIDMQQFKHKMFNVAYVISFVVFNIGIGSGFILNDIVAVKRAYIISLIVILLWIMFTYLIIFWYVKKMRMDDNCD